MPRSREENAARMREQREAEARAQEKVALQSEVMPKARSEARSAVTQKKLADDAAAFAAAIAPVPLEVLPTNDAERKRREREDAAQRKLLRKKTFRTQCSRQKGSG